MQGFVHIFPAGQFNSQHWNPLQSAHVNTGRERIVHGVQHPHAHNAQQRGSLEYAAQGNHGQRDQSGDGQYQAGAESMRKDHWDPMVTLMAARNLWAHVMVVAGATETTRDRAR